MGQEARTGKEATSWEEVEHCPMSSKQANLLQFTSKAMAEDYGSERQLAWWMLNHSPRQGVSANLQRLDTCWGKLTAVALRSHPWHTASSWSWPHTSSI